MRSGDVHVVFGVGQVGSFLTESLLRSGYAVRVAKRSPRGVPEGAEAVFGDATDPEFCRRAVVDAAVVYHCMNPAYSAAVWEDVLPKSQENLVTAAGSEGARLVVLENLYMVGTGGAGDIDEDTPFDPQSRKGEIRARLAESLLEAHERGDVAAVSGRASDFYGPRGTGTHFAERFWKPALAGKPAEFLPNPDLPHTYHFIPDVAEGLKALGTGPDEILGRPWMLPCAPAEPTRALVDRFGSALGSPIRLRGMPRIVRKVVGLFLPILREVDEMLHQWEVPFVVDDARFRARFGLGATDPDAGAVATVAWARREYGDGR
jgi:nucleoside-diphosphate-sugar epimerase